MAQSFDLHMHTTYCDGRDSAEDMVLAAIGMGLETVGISGHSFTPHDESYCMSREKTEAYLDELAGLKEKYAGRIRVLTGLEMDLYADTDTSRLDYMIGSVHYMFTDEGLAKLEAGQPVEKLHDWTPVDDGTDELEAFSANNGLGMMSLAEIYYRSVARIVAVTDCDVIGHFDLVTKFCDIHPLFDTEDPRYVRAWKDAADRIFEDCAERYKRGYRNRLEKSGLIEAGDKPVFEINYGAISKGYRKTPYPAQDQMDYIRAKGGLLICSSDSHRTEDVGSFLRELKK